MHYITTFLQRHCTNWDVFIVGLNSISTLNIVTRIMLVGYSSSSEDESEASNASKRLLSHSCECPEWKKPKVDVQGPKSRFESGNGQSSVQSVQKECVPTDLLCTKDKTVFSQQRLPLPVGIFDPVNEKEEDTEDTSQYEGRIRSFKHENGNWATYVYLPYFPEEDFDEMLASICATATAHGVALIQQKEFHLSLSQTVILRHHWIQPFTHLLSASAKGYSRFMCSAQRLRVYTNAEKTRTFLGMEVTTGQVHLLELIKLVDKIMMEFNLDPFYKNPSFHVSLAWCLGDFSEHLRTFLEQLQDLVDDHEDGAFWLKLDCHELHCRAGNKVFSFSLKT